MSTIRLINGIFEFVSFECNIKTLDLNVKKLNTTSGYQSECITKCYIWPSVKHVGIKCYVLCSESYFRARYF